MEKDLTEGKTFDKADYTQKPLPKGEYDNCTFTGCDFSNSSFSNIVFVDCAFVNCNITVVNLANTVLRDVKFTGCKMMGLRFEECNKSGVTILLEDCNVSHCSFYQLRLVKQVFKNTQLNNTDFTECNLTCAVFNNCDLEGAVFDKTLLEKADFRSAYNYTINPATNRVKKAKFSRSGIDGLLRQYDIEISEG